MKTALINDKNEMTIHYIDPKETSSDDYARLQNNFEQKTKSNYSYWYDLNTLENGMFVNYAISPKGANYVILQLPNQSAEDVDTCKRFLKRDYDVVSIKVVRIKKIVKN